VVCTANICRSPVAAGLLGHRLGERAGDVRSGGTHALLDQPVVDAARDFLAAETGRAVDHRARQLSRAEIEEAGIVLTMTREHRSWVVRNAPRAVRRTFALRELARIAELLPSDATYPSVRAYAEACAPFRSTPGRASHDVDIADPYGGPPAGYAASFGAIADAVEIVAASLRRHVP
jgi:protein-tyrosine phosphatase